MGTPENQMGSDPSAMDEGTTTTPAEGTTPPVEGDGATPDEGTMQILIDFLRSLFLDPQARQDYLADPGATINQLGLAGVSASDVHQACGIVADTLPPQQAARLSSYVNQGPSGGGGGGVVQSAVQEINYVINVSIVDDRDVIISDDDTSVVIGPGQGGTATGEEAEGGEAPEDEAPGEGGTPEAEAPGEGGMPEQEEVGDLVPIGNRPLDEGGLTGKEYNPPEQESNLPEDADMLPPKEGGTVSDLDDGKEYQPPEGP
jgi:hypothetical protein